MSNRIQLGLIGIATDRGPAYMASDFEAELAQCDPKQDLIIDIHSEGGSVFEGFRIGNAIADWEGKTIARVNAAAFSIASYVAVRCDEVEIAVNGFFMIHNPYSMTEGDDAAHAKQGQLLAELKAQMIETYAEKTGLDSTAVQGLMEAEPYIGSEKALEMGLADRVIESKASLRELPKNKLPSVVFAAMFGADGGKEPVATPEETIVKVSQPVAATVSAIKKAFPKASSDFVVKCMEDEMSMEDVGEEYAKSMEEENEELKAKVTAMKEELATFKAKAEEKADPVATAKAGAQPIAGVGVAGAVAEDPKATWDSAIEKYVAQGMTRQKAVIAANRNNPGLRQQVLAK